MPSIRWTTILFSILASIVLVTIENRSNVPSIIAIPVIVALLTKYVLGDWDKGFQWSLLDYPYWISILGSSAGVVYFLSNRSKNESLLAQ
jgi:hypothetical protein